ncbi:MAG: division/cell wall cluster transcriptional repressor MraZ [Paracoccaceae bacterium]
MAETFRGEFYQKVDGKARVSIPAPFRRVLESGDPAQGPNPRVVIVYGGERSYVECYTLAEMARIERRIGRMQIGSAQRRYLERNMITLSQTVEIDADGRIVLGPKAREKLGLAALKDGAEAVFAGTLDKFQIWRREAYEAELNAVFADDLLAAGQDMLSLLPPDPEA